MGKVRGRRLFFSFHYDKDVWRVNQVRNSNQPWLNKAESYWADASMWEKQKPRTVAQTEKLIDDAMRNTGVTVVLIGAETSQRRFVGYEIQQSHDLRKGLLGVYIHRLGDRYGKTDTKGANPFADWHITVNGRKVLLSEIYPTYDWVLDDGYNNLESWVEEAAVAVGRVRR